MEKHSKILVYVGTRPLFVIVNRFFCTTTVIKNILWQLVYSRWCSQTVCSMVCIVISFMQYIGTESTSAASNYKARSLSVCMSVCPFDYLENCSSNLLHTWCILLQTQWCAVHDLVQLRHSIHWKWINNYNQSNSALYIRGVGLQGSSQHSEWDAHTQMRRETSGRTMTVSKKLFWSLTVEQTMVSMPPAYLEEVAGKQTEAI